jgi:hypothetical protein
MKKKLYFLLAASVALFSACSSDDLSEGSSAKSSQMDDTAVNFGAYVNRGITRAGAAGTLTTNGDAPAVSLQNVGFGVFSYYSDSESYSETSKPNFMYNQLVSVKPNETDWSYSPLKYWPNEFGKNARSEGQDRLTFFAYAPYVQVNPSTGRVIKREGDGDNGIVGLTSNTTSGDPYVKYYVDMDPKKRVDLCWGVAKSAFTASVDGDAHNLVNEGWPYIDVVKPDVASKIDFDFRHALAAVSVQIDTDVDVEGHDANAADVDTYTRIWVRSVTFEGFTDKGRLNLNSNVDPQSAESGPQWFDLTTDSPVASGTVTVYDGRTDGKEGRDNAIAKKETPATLNAKIIQSAPYDQTAIANGLTISDDVPGVTKDAVNLFDAALNAPVYVIPTDDNLKVTIVYDVETYDANLATFLSDGAVKGSSVQNTIEKEITFQPEQGDAVTKLEAGKSYTIRLHLGLTSVKFDASVTDWVDDVTFDVDLPFNYETQYYTQAEADAYNATLDGAVSAGDPVKDGNGDPVLYTAETAAAYNAALDGAVQAGDVKTPATDPQVADAASAAAYNATLDGAVHSGDVQTPATNPDVADAAAAAAYNATLDGAEDGTGTYYSFEAFGTEDPGQATFSTGKVKLISQEGEYSVLKVITNSVDGYTNNQYAVHATDLGAGTFELLTVDGHVSTGISVKNVAAAALTNDEINTYNAGLAGAISAGADIPGTGTPAVLYNDETAAAYNATLPGAITAGQNIPGTGTAEELYDEAGAIEHNAALPDAVAAGDPVLYTAATAAAYNELLPGAVHAGDVKQ